MAQITPGVVTPVYKDGDQQKYWGPNHATDYNGVAYSGTFIPSFWSGKLAKKFYESTIFNAVANTDWQGEISGMGDTVIINTIPDVSVHEYKVGQNLDYDVMEPETISLKIDEGNYFGINVNDVNEYQAKPNLMNMFCTEAAYQMKQYVDAKALQKVFFDPATGNIKTSEKGKDALWEKNCGATAGAKTGAYNLGTDAAPIGLNAANIVGYVTTLSTVLDEANIPEEGRFLVISPAERQLLMQSDLAKACFTGDDKSIVRNGHIGKIDRFDIYLCNHLPRAAAGKTWLGGTAASALKRHLLFAGTKAGLSFASQITKVEHLRNPSDFGELVRGLNVWGCGVTQGQALTTLVAAN